MFAAWKCRTKSATSESARPWPYCGIVELAAWKKAKRFGGSLSIAPLGVKIDADGARELVDALVRHDDDLQ